MEAKRVKTKRRRWYLPSNRAPQVEAAANRRAIDALGRPPARQRRAAEAAPPFAAGLGARAPHAALLAELRARALPPHAACAALQARRAALTAQLP